MHINSWNTIEQACLASAVRGLGDNNWLGVCNLLRTKFALIERPPNWLTPETCETQYKCLSDKYVKMEISCERPVNQILQSLKLIARQEGQLAAEQEKRYKESRERLEMFAKNEIDSEVAALYYEDSLRKSRDRENNVQKHRDGLKPEVEKLNISKSPVKQDKTEGNSPLSTSPLLSSLLNNPPAVQYRPTLSTASFVPVKPTQGITRSASQTSVSDVNYKDIYSPDAANQSNTSNERASNLLYSNSTTASRKLDFQETSSAAGQRAASKEISKEVAANKESIVKSELQNLESMNLISTSEEYLSEDEMPQEILMQVIGNQLLDKVLDELTGDKDAITKKDLGSLDESFVAQPAIKEEPIVSVSAGCINSCDMVPELHESITTHFEAQNVIVIEDEPSNSEHLITEADISAEQRSMVETITVSTESPPSSSSSLAPLAINSSSESSSESKSDSEPLVKYLGTSSVKREVTTNGDGKQQRIADVEMVEAMDEVKEEPPADLLDVTKVETNESSNFSNETRESAESYETCESIADVSEPQELTENELIEIRASTVAENVGTAPAEENANDFTLVETNQQIENTQSAEQAESEETSTVSDISLTIESDEKPLDGGENNAQENEQSLASETICTVVPENTECTEVENPDLTTVLDDGSEHAVPSTSVPLEVKKEPEESVEMSTQAMQVSAIAEKNMPEEEQTDMAEQIVVEEVPIQEELKTSMTPANRNTRLNSRRRRSNASEANESESVTPTSSERGEAESKQPEEFHVTIKDFQTAGLDPEITAELLKPKEEPLAEAPAEVTPSNPKPAESRRSKQKVKSRRSSSRAQTHGSTSSKSDESTTPISSKPQETIQQITQRRTLNLAHQRLNAHKYSNTFQKPITNKTVAGYEDVIYCPIDLQTIKRKLDGKQISQVAEFQRDVLLMLMNAKMFNQIHSQVYNMAVEVQREALQNMQLTVQNLGEGVLIETVDCTEKARKRPSIDNTRRDLKATVKRTRTMPKDEVTPVKKIKLEVSENTSGQC